MQHGLAGNPSKANRRTFIISKSRYMKIFLPSILIIFFSLDCFAVTLKVSGKVTDRSGAPVSGATVKFVDSKNTWSEFVTQTNSLGQYFIDKTTSVATTPADNTLLTCYPNPFNRQTVISFHLDQRQRVEVAIYNIVGQKIRVVSSGNFAQGHHQMVWDGLSQRGTPVDAGNYICALQTGRGIISSIRMSVQGGENIATPVWSSAEDQSASKELTETPQIYNVSVSGTGFETHYVNNVDLTDVSEKDFVINRDVWTPFSTTGNYLGVYNGVDYTPFFIKGVNLGAAVPGAWPGQIAISSEQYAQWFRMIADAGFNTVRIYTLHYPRFYEEFARYNKENPDRPLYLIQGVWLSEIYSDYFFPDLHTLTAEFDRDIQDAVDCLHGNKKLEHRYGYSYGDFTADVSQWVLGLLIGREIYADEITETNISAPANTSHSGAHLSISKASPSEVWATQRLDHLIAYERKTYSTNRPVAFSSWPTLDPLTHPSESPWSTEDAVELDLNKIVLTDAPGGFFISYHIYSYFPNFINRDPNYVGVSDEVGPNSYLGYLRELREHYNYPIMVAEFGVPTSWGIGRYSQSGMHHGGMSEKEQGDYTMRMFHNIYDTQYCGGIVFAWADEWFKTTWITYPLSSGRRLLWHNIASPENNYGLIHFVPNPEYYNGGKKTQVYNFEKISKATVWHDFASFNVETTLKSPLSEGDTLWIAFDTYKRNMGESTLPNHKRVLNNRAEFLVRLTSDSAKLFVTEAYNLQGVTQQNFTSPAFQTKATDGKPWMLCKWENDWPWNNPNIQNIGELNICKESEKLGIHHAVQIRSDGVFIRIPWTLLNFSDPSESKVIDDNTTVSICHNDLSCGLQFLNSIRTEGIAVTLVYNNEVAEQSTYTWNDWDVNRQEILSPNMFIEVEKESLSIIREGLKNTPFTPKTK